jgi:hypothetical protein
MEHHSTNVPYASPLGGDKREHVAVPSERLKLQKTSS